MSSGCRGHRCPRSPVHCILGGSFSINSGLEAGTTVVVSIPVTSMFGSASDMAYPGALVEVPVAA